MKRVLVIPALMFASINCLSYLGFAALLSYLFATTLHSAEVRVVLGDPVIVAQAPGEVRGWGPYQFPHIERLPDGRLHVDYWIEADSATAYGKGEGHAFSNDGGKTWVPGAPDGGLILGNGDRIRPISKPSIPTAKLNLPKPLASLRGSYHMDYIIYEQLPAEARGYPLLRMKNGSRDWVEEFATVRIPGEVFYASEGVFALPTLHVNQTQWHVAPDKSLIVAMYPFRPVAEALRAKVSPYKMSTVLIRSDDHGKTWDMLSEIPYQPDTAADPHWMKRDGFTEPDICFLTDKEVICLIRTTDGNGVGPLYLARSADAGRTWSKPEVFDDLGVWPVLLKLKGGVTLAGYGRPGLYLRASADPAAKVWGKRVEVLKPQQIMSETCSYCDLLAVSDDTALLVYSDFHWPDDKGVKRKTILMRTVKVETDGLRK
jgi:hypothetical protein